MSCRKIEKKIIAAIDSKHLLQTDSELKKHLQKCPRCKALYDQLLLEDDYLIDAGKSFSLPAGLAEKIIAALPPRTKPKPKRTLQALRYAVAACALVLIVLFLYPKPPIAKVESLTGRLQLKTFFGWRELREEDSVRDRAVLRTLAHSEAKIVFKEGNYLRLDAESSVHLGARIYKDLNHIYRIEYGNIWAKVAHNYDGEFYIETPNALIIRVLGTEFNVRATPASTD